MQQGQSMQLFISYSRKNKDWVEAFWKELKENIDYRVWIDKELLDLGGANWWNEIVTNIEQSDCIIFIMSKDSLHSEYCLREIGYTLCLNKPVLPLQIEDCINDLPPELISLKDIQAPPLMPILNDMSKVILRTERSLNQIQNKIDADVFPYTPCDRPISPDDMDKNAYLFERAKSYFDIANYEKALEIFEQVIADDQYGIFGTLAQQEIEDYHFKAQRHKDYRAVKRLIETNNKEEIEYAWNHYVQKYGEDYDPDWLALNIYNNSYRIALIRIEECRVAKYPKLDLSLIDLTSVPPDIRKLTHLQHLDLRGNKLANLPVEIGYLSQLVSLNVSFNELVSLPSEIGQLSKLLRLDASRNYLKNLPVEVGHLSQLVDLNLSKNHLESLPTEVRYLAKLETLNVSNNQLFSIPDVTKHLKHLKNLNASKNQLASLPLEFNQLTQLEELDISNNQMENLPIMLGTLPRLVTLYVLQNPLTNIPDDIIKSSNTTLRWLQYQAREQGLI